MKVAILTQYYPPEVGAPQARLSALALAFAQRGHRVTVLTAMPNYPTGRIQDGYRGFIKREERDGVHVVRSLIYPTQSPDFARRLASYFSFLLSSAAVGTACLESLDYLLVESPPLFLGLTGIWLSRLKQARMVFNVSDLWPESAVRLGLLREGSTAHALSQWLEQLCYRHAWLVTGQSAEIVDDIARRFPGRATFHLSNGVDTDTFRPDLATTESRALLGDGNGNHPCLALYAGLHGLAQGLDQVLDAAEHLPRDCDVRFVLMGDGPTKASLVARARAHGNDRVRFLDPRPHRMVPAVLVAADILVVPLLCELPGAVPSKLYEAMATGRPVILVARGEAARIVERHGAGLVVAPGDRVGLMDAFRRLAADPPLRQRLGANGRTAAVQYFDRKHTAARFIDLLEQRL